MQSDQDFSTHSQSPKNSITVKKVLYAAFVMIIAALSGLSGALAGGAAVYRVMDSASRQQNMLS